MLRPSWASFVALSLAATACGNGSSGSPSGGPSNRIEALDFAAQYSSALCDGLAPCCASIAVGYDAVACSHTASSSHADVAQKALLPGVVYDGAAAKQCVELERQAVAACTPPADLTAQIIAACGAVLTGSLPPGSPCTDSVQCAAPAGRIAVCPDGSVPVGSTGTGGTPETPTAHICFVVPPTRIAHGATGDPCGVTCDPNVCLAKTGAGNATCYTDDGLCCTSSSLCAAVASVGELCTDGLWCGRGATCIMGTCAAYTVANASTCGSGATSGMTSPGP